MKKPVKTDAVERPVAAAERTLLILDAFARLQRTLTLGELAEETGLFKSVILRYMIAFEKRSYAHKLPDGQYQLGTKALQLGHAYERSLDQREAIHGAMRRLVKSTGESAFFYVRKGHNRMCLMGIDSPQSLRVSLRIGALIAMDSTSISQVLRAYHDGVDSNAGCDQAMIRFSISEYDKLTSSVSAPVFERSGALIGALSVSGPTARFDVEDAAIQGLVLKEARRLSYSFGLKSDETDQGAQRTEASMGP